MRAVVVWAHPSPDSFSATVCATAATALRRAGHQVEVLDLYREAFDPVMDREQWRAYRQEETLLDDASRRHADLVLRSEILVFVYPTWWFGLPAMLKGWLERVLGPGVAFDIDAGHGPRGRLGHVRHLVGISTYGSPRLDLLLHGDAGRRTLLRSVRLSCGPRCRSTWLALYDLDRSTAIRRATFLAQIDTSLGRRRPRWTTPLGRRRPRRCPGGTAAISAATETATAVADPSVPSGTAGD